MASCCVSLNLSIRKRSKTNTSDPAVVWGKERELTKRPEILAKGTAINLSILSDILVSVYLFKFTLFICHKGYKREKKKSLTVCTLMARKPKRNQQAYREWAPSDK